MQTVKTVARLYICWIYLRPLRTAIPKKNEHAPLVEPKITQNISNAVHVLRATTSHAPLLCTCTVHTHTRPTQEDDDLLNYFLSTDGLESAGLGNASPPRTGSLMDGRYCPLYAMDRWGLTMRDLGQGRDNARTVGVV